MQLLDIGNTNIKIYKNSRVETILVQEFDKIKLDEKFYYISVNQNLKDLKNGVDLKRYFKLKTNYVGLGIDRVAACYSINSGVIVDIGSAISIDVMEDGFHKGGVLLPGINSYQKSLKEISLVLDQEIDFNIDLFNLPNSTKDAISFGVVKSIILLIWNISKNKRVYFTGGDGKIFQKFFQNSIYKKNLVFDGMKKIIEEFEC